MDVYQGAQFVKPILSSSGWTVVDMPMQDSYRSEDASRSMGFRMDRWGWNVRIRCTTLHPLRKIVRRNLCYWCSCQKTSHHRRYRCLCRTSWISFHSWHIELQRQRKVDWTHHQRRHCTQTRGWRRSWNWNPGRMMSTRLRTICRCSLLGPRSSICMFGFWPVDKPFPDQARCCWDYQTHLRSKSILCWMKRLHPSSVEGWSSCI